MVKAENVIGESEKLTDGAKMMADAGALVTKDEFIQFFNAVRPLLTNGKDINKKLTECIQEAGPQGGA